MLIHLNFSIKHFHIHIKSSYQISNDAQLGEILQMSS